MGRFTAFAILATYLIAAVVSAAPAGTWQHHARRLTGYEEPIRIASLRALKQNKSIAAEVEKSLEGPDRYLALDVIATLDLQSTLPALFRASDRDEDGVVYLAINALITPDNVDEITSFYTRRLSRANWKALSVPSFVAILDVLGRLGHHLPEKQVTEYAQNEDPDVRSAAIYYARLISKRDRKLAYSDAVARGLKDPAETLRIQTRLFLREICKTGATTDRAKLCEEAGA